MGKFYSAKFTVEDSTARITSISNWFNALDGITSEVIDYEFNGNAYKAAKISIDNTPIEVLFGVKTTNANHTVVYAKNGDIYLINNTATTKSEQQLGTVNAYAYIHENIVLIGIKHMKYYDSGANNGVEILYLKTSENKYLIGYYRNGTNDGFVDISSMTFEDVDDTARVPYNYTNMFPYVATAGTIDFITEGFFVDGNQYKHFETDTLRECSTVSLLSTQSLPTGNCVALGAHCLAPLDEEEGE